MDIEIGGLILNGQKESESVVVEFLKELLKQKQFDKIEIQHLSGDHTLWNSVKNGLDGTGKAIYKLGIEWVGQIRDNSTGEVFNKNSSKTRATFRRKDKKLLAHFNNQLDIETVKGVEKVNYFIESADSIGKKSYQYAINVGVKNNKYWKNMSKVTAENNYFRGYLLKHKSEPIAYVQGLVFKDVFHLFATSFNPQYRNLSPGGFLLRKVIALLVNEKVNKIHFGYGDADYKRLYGTESKEESSFRLYGFTTRARAAKILDNLAVLINESIIGILEKTGLLKKIKKLWRSKLSKRK